MMDATWIIFSLAFITTIRPALSLFPIFAVIPPPYNLPWILFILFPISWVCIFFFVSVYDSDQNRSINNELFSLTLGSILSGVFLAGLLYLSYRDISRFLFILFFLLAYAGLISWRVIVRILLRGFRKRDQTRKILIIGENDITREFSVITKKKNESFTIEFLKTDTIQSEFVTNVLKKVTVDEFNDVIISVTEIDRLGMNDLLGRLHRLPVKVWVIPDYYQLTLRKAIFSELGGLPLLDIRAPSLNYYQRLIKRAFDLTITFLLLPLLSPVMLIAAVLIRLDSPGPVLLRQRRVGENGTVFNMYKFRTMVANAEELRSLVESYDDSGNLLHKKNNDPRVTKVGKFLRRWSLDEIPQFFNVLKAEMSLVGPRPELLYLVDRYETWQLLRFSVPQGITGWWQVNGRSEKPMHLNTADDIFYVQNYSILLDIYILIKTIGVVIHGKGAF